ncbi:MAG TPA: UvrD-helicase domain-containing protein [Acidimicrobiales bacterium]|nr:UvrD-helicase domain-containing protein [Acidimicrobiales bacterium]
MTAGAADRLLDDLDEAQREAVVSDGAPLVVLAGAGSGKTRVLTRRIAWRCATGSADARHVLAITFTRKAAGELRSRLRKLGGTPVTAGTFHSIALAQLRQRDADAGRRSPEILDRKARLLGSLLSRAGVRRSGATPAFEMAAEIEWAKARMIEPARYLAEAAKAGRGTSLEPKLVADLFARYEEEKKRRGLVDFDDLLISCADALEGDAEWAAAQRWRWRHFFVDEYQDVNPLQIRLLAAWRGERPDLCVVGDPDQSIYSWNGAEAGELPNFADRNPGTTVVRLRANYRCPAPVLAAARAALGPVGRSDPLPARRDGSSAPVEIRSFNDEEAEATGIASIVRARHVARRWSDAAVLVRTNAQAVPIQRALTAAGVPCRVRGGGLLREPEVRDALGALRRQGGLDEWTDATEALATEAAPDRAANLEALVTLAREFRSLDPGGGGPAFLTWLADAAGDEVSGAEADAVEISSFHRAKGLEWEVVVVAGVEEGYVPHYLSEADEALAEERRLLYVACTRASSDLILTWARKRSFGSHERRREPSPWLDAIEALDGKKRVRPERRPEPSRQARAPVGVDAADADLYEALRTWRLGVSRSSNVPAYVVFADATLAAIAAARPRDARGLLKLPGVGPVKIDRFGKQVLEVVASHQRGG